MQGVYSQNFIKYDLMEVLKIARYEWGDISCQFLLLGGTIGPFATFI